MHESTPWPDKLAAGAGQKAEAADRLRQLWLQGQRPNVGDFLAGSGSLGPAEVVAVLRVDHSHRWRCGEQIPAESYLRQHPAVAGHTDSALDLIYGEYLLRERDGEDVSLPDFLSRFPEHAVVLGMQIELHRALGEAVGSGQWAVGREEAAVSGEEVKSGGWSPQTADCRLPTADFPKLAGYDILAELGRGGMGVIYKARQVGLNRLVALKLISAGDLAGPVELARFRTEAESVAKLQHPHVVQIYEVGQLNRIPFLALEFMDRGSLASCLAGKPLAPHHAAELVETLARAVQAAHDHGIIHRDLKPANVLLATPPPARDAATTPPAGIVGLLGVPKITDFGLAKCLADDVGQTVSGAILGTPGYMAPEQAAGQTRHVGPAADIYALGAILYEVLLGRPPFVGATMLETLEMVRSDEPVSPSRLRPNLPRDLVTICLKALAKEPERRYATATALGDDLRRFQTGLPVKARRAPPWEVGWRWCARNPLAASLSAGLALLLVILLIGLPFTLLLRGERDKALANQQRAEKAEAEVRALSDHVKIQAHLANATAARRSRREGQRFHALAEIRAAMQLQPGPELRHALRNEACAALALPDLALAELRHPLPADTVTCAFDGTHAIYARTNRSGLCSIRRMADDSEIHSLAGLGKLAIPIMSADGRFVAVMHAGPAVQVWKVADVSPTLLLDVKQGYHVDFHRSKPQVALTYVDGAIGLFDLGSGRRLAHFPAEVPTREVYVALHPTEPLLATCSYFATVVQVRDCRTGKVVASLPAPYGPTHLAWQPNGRTLAVCAGDTELIQLYDRSTWKPYRTLKSGQGGYLAFNHAGDRLARCTWAGSLYLFDVGTGQKLAETTPSTGTAHRFSPDDRQLALGVQNGTMGRKMGLWQVGDGREFRLLGWNDLPADVVYRAACVSPDGRLLAAGRTGGFGLWDLASGSEVAFVAQEDQVRGVHFEPTGSLLTTTRGGLLRWPVQHHPTRPGQWVVGPSQQLLEAPNCEEIGQSRDGRVIVTCCRAVSIMQPFAGGWILHGDRLSQPIRLDPGADVAFITVSPDGRWVATATLAEGRVKIWDARDGKLVKQLAESGAEYPHFSPDGRWLSTARDRGRLFAVGTWEPGPQPGGRGIFSPHGDLMAINNATSVISLVNRATGQELTRLDDPHGGAIQAACFTPDGTKLITLGNDRVRGIRVWDLRLLRQQLRDLGLDWNCD
jgi:serine/threonine protein kinase/WD40 repeat protein